MTALNLYRMPNSPFLQVAAGCLYPTLSGPAPPSWGSPLCLLRQEFIPAPPSFEGSAGALPSVLEGGAFDFAAFLVRLASTETIH